MGSVPASADLSLVMILWARSRTRCAHEIGSNANIESRLGDAIDSGERLMGFGHRAYRVRDPRADVLKAVAVSLRGGTNRIRFAEAVERGALRVLARKKQNRRLDTNVEFYTALAPSAGSAAGPRMCSNRRHPAG
jgi:citrate synthase